MAAYILSIDQGTTSSRAIVFDEKFEIIGSAQQEFKQYFPQSGWVEHNPEDIWETTVATCRRALQKSNLRAADIAAAVKTWAVARSMLADPAYQLVVLDELTYMIAYDYLPEDEILAALTARPTEQSVVVTGRGGGKRLQAIMDTVSEVKEIKHAFQAGIKARQGVDY